MQGPSSSLEQHTETSTEDEHRQDSGNVETRPGHPANDIASDHLTKEKAEDYSPNHSKFIGDLRNTGKGKVRGQNGRFVPKDKPSPISTVERKSTSEIRRTKRGEYLIVIQRDLITLTSFRQNSENEGAIHE